MSMSSDLRKRVSDGAPPPTFDADDVRERVARKDRRRRISTIVVAVAIAASGISGLFLSGFGRPARTLPAARIDGVIRQAPLPITDALWWTTSQQRTMHGAESLLQSACMRRAGFDLPTVPFDPFDLDRRYGLKDLEAARTWGYGLPPMGPDPQEAYVASLSQEDRRDFYRAYLGAPVGAETTGTESSTAPLGCAAEARDTIYGSTDRAVRAEVLRQTIQNLDGEAYFAAEEDGLVRQAKDRWIDCMEERGYDVSALDDPMDASVLLHAGALEGGSADIELAVSVVRCNDATDLVEIWSGVEAEMQQELLNEHRSQMEEFLALRAQAVENAERIVREGSGSAP